MPAPAGPRPPDHFSALWDAGAPDLDAFLAKAGPLTPAELAAILRTDQRRRWEAGDRIPAEEYVRRLPQPPDPEAALDLIYTEYLLREADGERPDPDEIARRFPALKAALDEQVAFHRAVQTRTGDPTVPARRPESEVLPRTFGRYELKRLIARGGMGSVYLALDTALDREVALKIPRFDRDVEPAAAERFRREARAAAALRHPNLCPVYEVGRIDGTDYLTMPHFGGGTLSTVARRGPVPPADAVRLVALVADAMQAAHQKGVVHRDLKPSNVLLDERGDPIVADFGLARRYGSGEATVTRTGAVLGTAAYMPPEQIGCQPERVGPRADIYSLGVILYELLTGQLPFDGAPTDVLQKVLLAAPPPPTELRAGLDPRLEAVCLTAMAKDAGQRYQSMAEFAVALRATLEPEPIAPPRWILPVLAAASVVLLVVAIVWRVWPETPTAPTSEPTSPAVAADPFAVGTRWAGTFRFLAGDKPAGEPSGVTLTIKSRDGAAFEAEYETAGGYRWEAAGRVEGERVEWTLTRALTAKAAATKAAPKAVVRGTHAGGVFTGRYTDHDSRADMTLHPAKAEK